MLRPPPRDEHGRVVPHDHDQILNDDYVVRGISEHEIARNKNPPRLKSSLYQTSTIGDPPGMSVDHKPSMQTDNVIMETRYRGGKWLGAVLLNVGFLRGLGLQIGYSPIPDNPYHCEVFGNITGSLKKEIRDNASWIVPIEGIQLRR